MSVQSFSSENSVKKSASQKTRGIVGILLAWVVTFIGIGMLAAAFLPPESPYALSRFFWYTDFRYWPSWLIGCCWLIFLGECVSMTISLMVPRNEDRMFLLKRSFLLKSLTLFLAFLIFTIWYNYATLPLAEAFSPIISPITDYVYRHYTLPLADYYTTGEESNPFFWPTVGVIALTVLFVVWRVWFYIRRWKNKPTPAMSLALAIILPIILGADKPVSTPPKKVETSVGIYDVQSKEDVDKFTVAEIRELVKMEDNRSKGAGLWPHPVLVYCFEERSFQYTGGKYDNAEIKYRLRVPQKIVPGKKYPLAIHLHGIGETGNDNTFSLAHLHSILPLMVGAEQQDFFLLVLQCPKDNRQWTFKEEKDGNLDLVVAAIDSIVQENPIDANRLSIFGLSSGGSGAWRLALEYPDKFAALVPASCSAPYKHEKIPLLKEMAIWTFKNKSDSGVSITSIRQAMNTINGSGGYMKLTQFDQGGHAAWRPAMDEYNCFAWMTAQKRGGWFNPPPERKVYQGRSLSESFYAFFLPLILAAGLFAFQRTALCERLHERIAGRLYRRWDDDEYEDDDEDDEEEEEDESDDESTDEGFRIFTDITGTKKIKAKMLGFQGDTVRLQFPDGKITPVAIKHFSEADQQWLRKMRAEQPLPEEFRKWSNAAGTQSFVAKFVGFQGDDKVLLQSQAGQTMPVPINQLGQAEQEFLTSRRGVAASDPPQNGFRFWTDTTGAKKITAKLVEILPDGKVRLESQAGKAMTVDPKFFCEADRQFLAQIPKQPTLPEGFRKWSNAARTQSFVAKFVGFQGDDKVLLQSQAGKTMPVPINQLGQAEQDFLAEERQRTAPSLDDFRAWSDITGTKTFTAKLRQVDGEQVHLETEDGRTITLPIDELAVEDQMQLTQHSNKTT